MIATARCDHCPCLSSSISYPYDTMSMRAQYDLQQSRLDGGDVALLTTSSNGKLTPGSGASQDFMHAFVIGSGYIGMLYR